jgi:hypothetical protein
LEVSRGKPENLGSQRIGLWCNWVFVALTAIGWLGIAHFWLPARADLGLEATKVWFSEMHHSGVIMGCIAACTALVWAETFTFSAMSSVSVRIRLTDFEAANVRSKP